MSLRAVFVVMLLGLCAAPLVAEEEASPLVPAPRWKAMGIEGKWVTVTELLDDPKQHAALIVGFLHERGESELLEWLVVYRAQREALDALIDLDDPRWIRATVWGLHAAQSHGADTSRSRLLQRDPARVLGWLERHPEVKGYPGVARLMAGWKKTGVLGNARSTDLPPLKVASVFRHLAPPASVGVLDRATSVKSQAAEGPTRFRHQVVRAIEGLRHSRRRPEAQRKQLEALLAHQDVVLQQRAALAFASLPVHQVPYETFFELYRDDAHEPKVRAAAFLTCAQLGHPHMTLRALREFRRGTVDLALWRVATSHLTATDDPHLVHVCRRGIGQMGGLGLFEEKHAMQEVLRSDERRAAMSPEDIAALAVAGVERGAWFILVGEGHGVAMRQEQRLMGVRMHPRVRAQLHHLATHYDYTKRFAKVRLPTTWREAAPEIAARMTALVRRVAQKILDAKDAEAPKGDK